MRRTRRWAGFGKPFHIQTIPGGLGEKLTKRVKSSSKKNEKNFK
jgi:hypothetical protein